jgi:hypothetical protein
MSALTVAADRAVPAHSPRVHGDYAWLGPRYQADIKLEAEQIITSSPAQPTVVNENPVLEFNGNVSNRFVDLSKSYFRFKAYTRLFNTSTGALDTAVAGTSVKISEQSLESSFSRLTVAINDTNIYSGEFHYLSSFIQGILEAPDVTAASADGCFLSSSYPYRRGAAGAPALPNAGILDRLADLSGPSDQRGLVPISDVDPGASTGSALLSLVSPGTTTRTWNAFIYDSSSSPQSRSQSFTVCVRPNAPGFLSGRLIPAGSRISVTIARAANSISTIWNGLSTANTTPYLLPAVECQLYLESAELILHTVELTEAAKQAFMMRWQAKPEVVGLKGPLYYPVVNPRIVFGQPIAAQTTVQNGVSVTMTNAWTGRSLPLCVIVGFANTAALSGGKGANIYALSSAFASGMTAGLSPLLTHEVQDNSMNVLVNGVPVEQVRGFGDIKNDVRAYERLYQWCKQSCGNCVLAPAIASMVPSTFGYSLYLFNLQVEGGTGASAPELLSDGPVSLDMQCTVNVQGTGAFAGAGATSLANSFTGITPFMCILSAECFTISADGTVSTSY